MKALVLLLVVSAPALAAEPKVCKPEGKPLIKLQHIDQSVVTITSKDSPPSAVVGAFVIFPNGATTSFDRDPNTNKVSNERSGCLRDEELSALKTALKAATWKTTPVRVHCMAIAARHTEWTTDDKKVWDEKTCASQTPDAATQTLIDLVHGDESTAKTDPN
jgi:hypothetical protein